MTNIYCGTEEYVIFFEELNKSLELNLDYDVCLVDGKYEIDIKN